jgi:hypothetical protein
MDEPMIDGVNRQAEVARPGVPWKAVALPVEHGGWSFLLEPVILGFALVPSRAGACLAMAALAAFLTRHPLRLLAIDYRKHVRYPRTALAERFVLGYGALAGVFVTAALGLTATTFIPAVAAAAPFALIALALDLTGRGREAIAELSGSVALGASACAIILAGGGSPEVAWIVWLLQSLRAVTAILYVRARLRHERAGDASVGSVAAAHGAALALVVGLAWAGLTPRLAVVAFLLLLARAANGLLRPATGIRPQMVGVQEVVFGIATLVLLVTGFRLGI